MYYMTKFIKLTNILFNTNNIQKIVINPNKYCIYIVNNSINGFSWSLGGCGIGSISSYIEKIEVCETEHSTDYKTVSNWIKKIK